VRDLVAAICPFLVAADGAWRSATPSRDHRCGATDPPGRLPPERQQALCLGTAHLDCPLFDAATSPTVVTPPTDAAAAAAALDPGAVPATLGQARGGTSASSPEAPAFVSAMRANPRSIPVILDLAKSTLDVQLPRLHLPSRTSPAGPPASAIVAPDADRVPQQATPNDPANDPAHVRREALRAARERARAMARPTGPDSPSHDEEGAAPAAGLTAAAAGTASLAAGSAHRDPGAQEGLAAADDQVRSPAAPRRPAPGPRRFMVSGRPGARPAGAPSASLAGGLERVRATISGRQGPAALAGLAAIAVVLLVVVVLAGGLVGGATATRSPGPSAARTTGPGSSALPASAAPSGSPAATPETSASESPSPTASAGASPSVSPKPSASPAARTYRVRAGDTLSSIATRFKTTVAALMKLNKITDPRSLRIGQVLKLP
jgi:hypothetical protein